MRAWGKVRNFASQTIRLTPAWITWVARYPEDQCPGL